MGDGAEAVEYLEKRVSRVFFLSYCEWEHFHVQFTLIENNSVLNNTFFLM